MLVEKRNGSSRHVKDGDAIVVQQLHQLGVSGARLLGTNGQGTTLNLCTQAICYFWQIIEHMENLIQQHNSVPDVPNTF
jgi:hypothetical protein